MFFLKLNKFELALAHKIKIPINVKLIPRIRHCVLKSSENKLPNEENKCDSELFLKNLSLKRIYIMVETRIVFKAESLFFQFKNEIIMIPADTPKNIQI